MTRRADLLALAARVEAATGADPGLDLAIAREFGITVMRQRKDDSGADPYTYRKFTESLADAEWLVQSKRGGGAFAVSRNSYGRSNATVWWNAEFNRYCDGGGYHGCATPALALTAAALRAMAEEAGDE